MICAFNWRIFFYRRYGTAIVKALKRERTLGQIAWKVRTIVTVIQLKLSVAKVNGRAI